MNNFLYCWLFFIGILHIIAGLLVCFFIGFDRNNSYINYLFSTLNINNYSTDNINHILLSNLIPTLLKLFGPVIIGWGILFSALIYCLRTPSLSNNAFIVIKLCCIVSTFSWYGLDSFIAWQVGLKLHLGFNLATTLLITLPLILIRPPLRAKV